MHHVRVHDVKDPEVQHTGLDYEREEVGRVGGTEGLGGHRREMEAGKGQGEEEVEKGEGKRERGEGRSWVGRGSAEGKSTQAGEGGRLAQNVGGKGGTEKGEGRHKCEGR